MTGGDALTGVGAAGGSGAVTRVAGIIAGAAQNLKNKNGPPRQRKSTTIPTMPTTINRARSTSQAAAAGRCGTGGRRSRMQTDLRNADRRVGSDRPFSSRRGKCSWSGAFRATVSRSSRVSIDDGPFERIVIPISVDQLHSRPLKISLADVKIPGSRRVVN